MKTKNKKIQLKINLVIILGLLSLISLLNAYQAKAANVTKEEIIALVNQERKQAGLNELVESAALDKAAVLKAQDMIGNNYFSHVSPKGIDPWFWFEKANYQYKYAGENLAMDFTSAPSVHKAWMKSPTHKENIVSSKYQEIGVAVIDGVLENRETQVAVQLFGSQFSPNNSLVLEKTEAESNLSIKIEDASVEPWKETKEDELLVYARVTGDPEKVLLRSADKQFELIKHRDDIYMNLFSLGDLELTKNDLIIEAVSKDNQSAFFPVSKDMYQKLLEKEQEDFNNKLGTTIVASANEVISSGTENWQNFIKQNVVLAGGFLLFVIIIANIWVLEVEEEKLLQAYSGAN